IPPPSQELLEKPRRLFPRTRGPRSRRSGDSWEEPSGTRPPPCPDPVFSPSVSVSTASIPASPQGRSLRAVLAPKTPARGFLFPIMHGRDGGVVGAEVPGAVRTDFSAAVR